MAEDPLQKARRALQALDKELVKLEKARGAESADAAPAKRRGPTKASAAAVAKNRDALDASLTNLFGAAADLETTTFAEFFKVIGTGLVDAQKEMDDATREYLAGISGNRFLQPSIFRIPKLTAQMKFGLEKKKGFNLFFTREDIQSQQQSVEFDVVSAPPPSPGHAAPFLYEPVLSPPKRKSLFESIQKAGGSGDLLNNAACVLILANEAGSQYLVLFAEGVKCGVWFLLDVPGAPVLVPLRAFAAGGVDAAAKVIAAQGESQAKFLKSLE